MTAKYAVEFSGLTKHFGVARSQEVTAVKDLTFAIEPGRVVGLLGRNGAGKSTALRCLLGLARPSSGTAHIFGREYSDLPNAAHRVGVAMDCIGFVPGATGRQEIEIWSTMLGVGRDRVEAVLELVGLSTEAQRRIKKFSTGMRQRLSLALATLASPELLILDEPANGLDPDGVRWLRTFIRKFAENGGTVLLSSHLLAEVEQTVDDLVILAQTVRYAGPLRDLVAEGDRLEDRFFELVGSPEQAVLR